MDIIHYYVPSLFTHKFTLKCLKKHTTQGESLIYDGKRS